MTDLLKETNPSPVNVPNASEPAIANVATKESLYSRALLLLESRDFEKAGVYFERVLDADPHSASAYMGALLAAYGCVGESELVGCTHSDWTDDARFANAVRFADGEQKKAYEELLAKRKASYGALAAAALEEKNCERCIFWCEKHLQHFPDDKSIRLTRMLAAFGSSDMNELYEHCTENALSLSASEEYRDVTAYLAEDDRASLERLARSIDIANSDKKRTTAYSDTRLYMSGRVNSLKNKAQELRRDRYRDHVKEAEYIEALRNSNGKFYGSNPFLLVLAVLLWAIPFYMMIYLIGNTAYSVDDTAAFFAIFFVMFGVFVAILLISRLIRAYAQAAKRSYYAQLCRETADSIDENEALLAEAEERAAAAERYLSEFLGNTGIPVERIEGCRREFDELFNQNDDQKKG